MLEERTARRLANEWIEAWNAHDLDAVMEHHDDAVVLISPVAAQLLGDGDGTVRGKRALRAYFEKGLQASPELRFELIDTLWGLQSVVLYYRNQRGTKTAEVMEVDPSGRVRHVIANYSD